MSHTASVEILIRTEQANKAYVRNIVVKSLLFKVWIKVSTRLVFLPSSPMQMWVTGLRALQACCWIRSSHCATKESRRSGLVGFSSLVPSLRIPLELPESVSCGSTKNLIKKIIRPTVQWPAIFITSKYRFLKRWKMFTTLCNNRKRTIW